MRILERYIIGRLVKSFFFLTLNFLLLYLIVSLLSDLQDILKANINVNSLLSGYMFNLVTISGRILTFAFLIASLHLIGTLNYHNEITAMRTEGMGIMYLSRIFIITAVLVSLFCLFIDNNILPLLRNSRASVRQSKLQKHTTKKVIDNFACYAQDGYFIFAKKFDVRKNKMKEVNIFRENGAGKLQEEIIASELYWHNHRWHLKNGIHYRLVGNDFTAQNTNEEELLSLSEPPARLAAQTSQSWQYLSLQELRHSIKSFSRWKSSKIADILKLEFHKKIAFSFSSFFLLLAALPFALQIRTRRAGLSSLGTAIIFYFFYYVLSSLSLALGKIEFFSPLIAAWLTNIFFGISGLVGLISLQ